LFGTFDTAWQAGRQSAIDAMGGEEVIDGSHILLVEDSLVETANSGNES
jgi:hypothetical protein